MKSPCRPARLLYWTAVLWLGGAIQGLALELVREGKAIATIVASSPSEDAESAAARPNRKRGRNPPANDEALATRVLVEWVKKITDTELPVAEAAPEGGPAIYVGKAAEGAGLKLDDIPSPSREGLRIVADDQRVLIGGQSDAATLKAVCRFLEELGCRYFMDGPLGEVYPRSRSLRVGSLALTESPGLMGRNPKGPSWSATLWKAWNGAGGEVFQHQHAWGSYLAKDLFSEHPAFFALGADGRRKPGDWLCTSNPELRKYFADQVIAAIERGLRHPSISPPDGGGYCQCAACKAQDDPTRFEPSTGMVSISTRYVDFFDDVARRVALVHPESVLSFYCYADYTQPPASTRKLSPNLCAVIAPIRYCRLHEIGHPGCTSREQQAAMTDGWAAIASRLGYYNYMYNLADGTLPCFKFTACRKEFPYLKDQGLSYMTIEVLSNWHIYGPQIYLSLRLAYNPKADAAAIMEDYWQRFYGPRAAPFMKQYWMGIDSALATLPSHAGSFYGLQQIYTPQFLERCRTPLAQAAKAAQDDERYAQRVRLHTEGFQSAVDYQGICEAMNRGDFGRAQSIYDALVRRLQALSAQGLANPEYATAYLERFLRPTVTSGTALTAPPSRLLQVLPDRWRFAADEKDQGLTNRYHVPEFDDASWPWASTVTKTLDAQGLAKTTLLWYRTKFSVPETHGRLLLYFGEVDGVGELFVNGSKMQTITEWTAPSPPSKGSGKQSASRPDSTTPNKATWATAEGRAKARRPFSVDVSDQVHPGQNVVALRVDHSRITELSLGGILRPVLLIEKPD